MHWQGDDDSKKHCIKSKRRVSLQCCVGVEAVVGGRGNGSLAKGRYEPSPPSYLGSYLGNQVRGSQQVVWIHCDNVSKCLHVLAYSHCCVSVLVAAIVTWAMDTDAEDLACLNAAVALQLPATASSCPQLPTAVCRPPAGGCSRAPQPLFSTQFTSYLPTAPWASLQRSFQGVAAACLRRI